jgi:quercetin dioxygenase-like cupin family protein
MPARLPLHVVARRRLVFVSGLVVLALPGLAGYAGATLADSKGFSFSLLSKATIPDGVDIATDGATDLYTVRVRLEPGGTTGWHHHATATAVAAVTQGTMTLRTAHGDSCQSKVLPTGVASVEPMGAVHEARNDGAVPVEFYFTFFGQAGTPILVDAQAPPACR